ncbi:MAG: acyl-CoA dehydrogenase family protein, partial [Flavobacteriales bacterium]
MSKTDYYLVNDLLSEEHRLIRQSTREWVNKEIIPYIDEANQKHQPIEGLFEKLGEIGALGCYIPEQYGGLGLDQISYGIIMQELERGDSAIRSTASVQSSLVMYPIYNVGSDEQKIKY